MENESRFGSLETISLQDGRKTTFVILDTIRISERCYHLVVDEEEITVSGDTGILPPLFCFEEANDQLVPLNQEQLRALMAEREAQFEGRCAGLNPVASLKFDQDAFPVRFEVEDVAHLEGEGLEGRIVALFNTTDDHDIRILAYFEDRAGSRKYEPLPGALEEQAKEIASFLAMRRRLLRGVC